MVDKLFSLFFYFAKLVLSYLFCNSSTAIPGLLYPLSHNEPIPIITREHSKYLRRKCLVSPSMVLNQIKRNSSKCITYLIAY